MNEFSASTRQANIERLASENFDFVIIGGGINGAGAARDAALRGYKVALIEARDFAYGTSSRSSKLIHGGIRYLENFEFKLVFEALSERARLFEMAPHLVHPLRFTLPVYKGDRVGMFKMNLGMLAYDALALFEVPRFHERLNPKECRQRVPSLNEDGLLGGFEYSDAYMDDDRLVIETIRSAHENGAIVANYVQASNAQLVDGRVIAIEVKDEESGRSFKIRGQHFISTVGPWTDRLASKIFSDWKSILRPSKGIHLTLERQRLPLENAVVLSTRADKRIIFCIPRHEMIIIGTTDTDFDSDPSDVSVSTNDVEYLFKIIDQYFPHAKIRPEDIVASYVGVRPLVADNAETESSTSREHLIFSDPRNVTFVAGGKYTTYRKMAQETIDVAARSSTVKLLARADTTAPLNSLVSPENYWRSKMYISKWAHEFGFNEPLIDSIVNRHGMEASEILELGVKGKIEDQWCLEALHAIRKTMCFHLLDFYSRRTPLLLAKKNHGLELLDRICDVFSAELGWSSEIKSREKKSVTDFVAREYKWKAELSRAL